MHPAIDGSDPRYTEFLQLSGAYYKAYDEASGHGARLPNLDDEKLRSARDKLAEFIAMHKEYTWALPRELRRQME